MLCFIYSLLSATLSIIIYHFSYLIDRRKVESEYAEMIQYIITYIYTYCNIHYLLQTQ
jgi:hypothetical protein